MAISLPAIGNDNGRYGDGTTERAAAFPYDQSECGFESPPETRRKRSLQHKISLKLRRDVPLRLRNCKCDGASIRRRKADLFENLCGLPESEVYDYGLEFLAGQQGDSHASLMADFSRNC